MNTLNTSTLSADSSFGLPKLFQSAEAASNRRTMLAYEATFYPAKRLSIQKHKIAWAWSSYVTKAELLSYCNQDMTELTLPVKGNNTFPIRWEYNKIPTLAEWNKMQDNCIFCIQARVSGLIDNGRCVLIIPTGVLFSGKNFGYGD
jgi:hypothetical protein